MAPEKMAGVLWAVYQPWLDFFTLLVTYFVHNVAATVPYVRKELLEIRTAITRLELDE
jgi:hypothetical protein